VRKRPVSIAIRYREQWIVSIYPLSPHCDRSTIDQSTKLVVGSIASSITSGSLAMWSPVCRPGPVGGSSEVRPCPLTKSSAARAVILRPWRMEWSEAGAEGNGMESLGPGDGGGMASTTNSRSQRRPAWDSWELTQSSSSN